MYNPHVLGDMNLDFTILLPLDRPLSLLPFRILPKCLAFLLGIAQGEACLCILTE